jgi:hypothetical protein
MSAAPTALTLRRACRSVEGDPSVCVLGNADVSACRAGDASHDGQIIVDEILTAVNNALNGCGGLTCGLRPRHYDVEKSRVMAHAM